MSKFNGIIKGIGDCVSKNSTVILTVLAVGGIGSTAYLSFKAAPKIEKAVKAAEDEKGDKLTAKETAKVVWKPLIPPVVSGITTAACVISANTISNKKQAALVAAYKVSETALLEYSDAVIETIGEKKERAIRDKVAEKHATEAFVNREIIPSMVTYTGKGKDLFYDGLSGRYFMSSKNEVEKAINGLNSSILNDSYISLNEYFNELGLDCTALGNDMGWNSPDQIDVYFGHAIYDDTLCWTIDHYNMPSQRYSYR